MEIKHVNMDTFDDVISNKDILVDFYAQWCPPCKMLTPELEKIKDEVEIIKVNVDDNIELCQRYGVMSVPTLIYFKKDGTMLSNVGYMSSEDILSFIKK